MKRRLYQRRRLQCLVAVFALVPISAGLTGILLGPDMISDAGSSNISMDSHYRYLSGLLMAIGFGFWSTVPSIETSTRRFQLLTAIVFVGGLGRLYSLIAVGTPDAPMLFGLTMELIVTPLLALWQYKISKHT